MCGHGRRVRGPAPRAPRPPRSDARPAPRSMGEDRNVDRARGSPSRTPTSRRARRSTLAPYALLAGAVAVAVVVGTLTSSRLPDIATATPAASNDIAVTKHRPSRSDPARCRPQEVEYVSLDRDGLARSIRPGSRRSVRPGPARCATTQPSEVVSIGPSRARRPSSDRATPRLSFSVATPPTGRVSLRSRGPDKIEPN